MDDNIEKHFDEFYNKLIFLDKKLGEEEKSYILDKYFTIDTEGKRGIISWVNEEYEKDENIYLRDKGLVLTFVYGGYFNKKHKSLEVYIEKDPYYKGEDVGSIKDLLLLLDEFIENNYKEFQEKINKIIYGTDNTKNVKVKYRPSNILRKDFIRVIKIKDAIIKDGDIEKIKDYKNLRELSIRESRIDAKNLSNLKVMLLNICDSTIDNFKVFNNIDCGTMMISNSKFLDDTISPMNLDVRTLRLVDLDIDYELLFLNANFKDINFLEIDGYELKPIEVELLRVFWTAKEINVDGSVNSYDFFNDLPELEMFRGYIESLDEEWYIKYKDVYKDLIEFFELEEKSEIKRFLFSKEIQKVLKNNEDFRKIRLPKVGLTKWNEKIRNAVDEDVRDIYKLSSSARKSLGSEKEISFVETEIIDPFNIMFKETDDFYLSKIVGPDGKRLIKPAGNGYTDYYYILGANGEKLERIEKTKERNVTIPEYVQEYKDIKVSNSNNIFDYYYNRQFSEKYKVTYLTELVKEYLDKQNVLGFSDDFKHNGDLFKEMKGLQEKIEGLDRLSILNYAPRHKMEEVETTYKGKPVMTYRDLPDDFIKEDMTLFQALFRTRDLEVIRYSLEEIFTNEDYDTEDRKQIIGNIEKLLEYWEKIDRIKIEVTPLDEIVRLYMEVLFEEITTALESEDYRVWYLSDIEAFLARYGLDRDTREVLVNYILLRQCSNRKKLLEEKAENEEKLFVIDECYSIIGSSGFYEISYGTSDFEELYSKGYIKREEYDKYLEFLSLLDRNSKIDDLLDVDSSARRKAYQEMMPLIDNFTLEDLIKIKNGVVIADEYEDKFRKFADYLYFYIYGEYPEWIRTELRKCSHILDKYETETHREIIPEKTYHVKEHVKVNRNTWEF